MCVREGARYPFVIIGLILAVVFDIIFFGPVIVVALKNRARAKKVAAAELLEKKTVATENICLSECSINSID